jgi:very-short-patch-repair endonuclease
MAQPFGSARCHTLPAPWAAMKTDPDRAVEQLARRQHGAFSRAQAVRAGVTPRMIDSRLQSGAWLALARGVYAHAAHPATWRRQVKAAELSVPGSAISHRAAAVLHDLAGFRPGRIDLTAAPPAPPRSSLASVHRRSSVPATHIDGIATTTLSRTVIDLAGVVEPSRWAALVDEVVVARRASVAELQREYERLMATRCRGIGVAGRGLANRSEGEVPAASELERVLRKVLDDPRLPPAEHQVAPPWWPNAPQRVDGVIPALRRIVEADGRRWHTREADFDRDRARDHLAQRHGHEVTRFTYRQLVDAPAYALEVLLDIARQAGLSS